MHLLIQSGFRFGPALHAVLHFIKAQNEAGDSYPINFQPSDVARVLQHARHIPEGFVWQTSKKQATLLCKSWDAIAAITRDCDACWVKPKPHNHKHDLITRTGTVHHIIELVSHQKPSISMFDPHTAEKLRKLESDALDTMYFLSLRGMEAKASIVTFSSQKFIPPVWDVIDYAPPTG